MDLENKALIDNKDHEDRVTFDISLVCQGSTTFTGFDKKEYRCNIWYHGGYSGESATSLTELARKTVSLIQRMTKKDSARETADPLIGTIMTSDFKERIIDSGPYAVAALCTREYPVHTQILHDFRRTVSEQYTGELRLEVKSSGISNTYGLPPYQKHQCF